MWELGTHQASTLPNSNIFKTKSIPTYLHLFLYKDEIRYSITVSDKKYLPSGEARSSPGADAPKF